MAKTIEKEEAGQPEHDKRANFKRIASLRVTNALEKMRVIEKLANPAQYEFDEGDVAKIERALSEKVQQVATEFRKALAGEKRVAVSEQFDL
jgi:hypothetical protein